MGIFKNKKKNNEFLSLYFSSQAVRGLVFEKGAQGIIIKKYSVQPIQKFDTFDFSAAKMSSKLRKAGLKKVLYEDGLKFTAITKSLQLVLKDLQIEPAGMKNICLVGLPGHTVQARISKIAYQRKNVHLKIDRKEKEYIESKVFLQVKKEVSTELKNQGINFAKDCEIIKETILAEKIAGYQVHSLVGFRGKLLEFDTLTIFGCKKELLLIRQVLDSAGLKNYAFYHIAEGIYKVTNPVKEKCGLFLNIEDKTTQMIYSQNQNSVSFISEFSVGNNDFMDHLRKTCGLAETEAVQLLEQFEKNQLTENVKTKIDVMLQPVFEKWLQGFKEMANKKERLSFLPSTMLIFGEGIAGSLAERLEGQALEKPFAPVIQVRLMGVEGLPIEIRVKLQEPIFIPLVLISFCI